jgi:SanA protein
MAVFSSPGFRRWAGRVLGLGVLGLLVVAGANAWVLAQGRGRIFTSPATTPVNDVALVLGTSRVAGDRVSPNLFFNGRLNAAAALYRAGRVKHLLLSGGNSHTGYDEPTWMRDELVKRGVPAAAMTLDYAGFRTLDSMARAKAVFGLNRCTIVTDDFHLPRALFLARAQGLEAIGCSSVPVPWKWSKKTRLREIASRTVACLDVYVLHTAPHFYGPRVDLPIGAAQ